MSTPTRVIDGTKHELAMWLVIEERPDGIPITLRLLNEQHTVEEELIAAGLCSKEEIASGEAQERIKPKIHLIWTQRVAHQGACVTKHRAKLARERAGLSVGQACKLLGLTRDVLLCIEDTDSAFDSAFVDADGIRAAMADVYGVNPEWLAGDIPQHDYARVDRMEGADKLTFHDRDIIAELVAAMPRGTVRRP